MRTILRAALLGFSPFLSTATFASDFAGPNQFICGNTAGMQANPLSSGESGFWSVVVGSGNFLNSASPTSLVSNLSYGENVLSWTVFGPGGTASDQVSIFCYDPTMPPANAGPDQTVDAWPGSTSLSGSAPVAPATCYWSVVSGTCVISDTNDPLSTVHAIGAGTNVLQWNCDNGPCGPSTDQMTINAIVGIAEVSSSAIDLHYDAISHRLLFGRNNAPMSVTLFDGQGRLAQQLNAPAGIGAWDLSGISPGVYVVQAKHDAGSIVQRIVVD